MVVQERSRLTKAEDGPWFGNFHREDPVLYYAVCRHFLDSGKDLGELQWFDLLDLPNIGEWRVLKLVNFLRRHGVELPWFAEWDKVSVYWVSLLEKHREPPVGGGQLPTSVFDPPWFDRFREIDGVLWCELARRGVVTLESLGQLQLREFLSWYNIGVLRALKLVNFLRSHQVELPWFAQFDKETERSAVLRGKIRLGPVGG